MRAYTLHHGDCLQVMRAMPDNSVDAIVTDPPYGLEFMGKEWDAPWKGDNRQPGDDSYTESASRHSNFVRYGMSAGYGGDLGAKMRGFQDWTEQWAREALRVLKPGGHLLAFSGSRTYHRMACAIEDAGFEIRDQIMWLYGSGFPKSLDVSKAIDKAAGRIGKSTEEIKNALKAAHDATGKTLGELNAACGFEASGYLRTSSTWATVLPTADKWAIMRDVLGLDQSLDAVFAEAEREVIGKSQWSNSAAHFVPGENHTDRIVLDITAPATDEAKQWDGWGTALKPAHEPICVARKPLIGTVAANVLQFGTGALNIDACRVPTDGAPRAKGGKSGIHDEHDVLGRWPANVAHDGSAEVVALFPAKAGAAAPVRGSEASSPTETVYGKFDRVQGAFHADSGSAARFFYCAKATRRDRNEGCEQLDKRPLLWSSGTQNPGSFQSDGTDKSSQNHHPTVKPTALMQWLVRLVTPKGGMVLDPFMGSGSTGKACVLEGVGFIGIEREADYIAIAEARIAHARQQAQEPAGKTSPQLGLFGEDAA